MSNRTTFIERALKGDVLDLSSIDDDIEAWHCSSGGEDMHAWLGMAADEYQLFVELPESLGLIFLARKRGTNVLELLRSSAQSAAELTPTADFASIRRWLETNRRM